MARVNFKALMRERGKVVPNSLREGHNVFTTIGRELMCQLMAWQTPGATDVAYTHRRVRWIGVGSGRVGFMPETRDVVGLITPLEVSGGDYLVPIDHLSTVFPTVTSVRYYKEFSETDLSSGGAVLIREAALYSDVSPTLVFDPTDPYYGPADPSVGTSFYKTFEGMLKAPGFTLEITWDMKF